MTDAPGGRPSRPQPLSASLPPSERATIAARCGLGLAVLFFLGVMNRWLADGVHITGADVTGGLYATLILVNPVASLVAGALLGYKHGIIWLFAPLAGVAFIPATYVVYNESAMPYAIGYMVFALLGMLVGRLIDRVRSRRA